MADKPIPAFPVPMIPCDGNGGYTEVYSPGMDLLDWFAGQAMAGDWAAQDLECGYWSNDGDQKFIDNRAELYYRMAEAMMRARENRKKS